MADELRAIGAEPVVHEGAAAAAEDERRHATICAGVAEAYGVPNAADHTPPRETIGRPDMDERDRVLWEVVAVCCVGETMNASLLTATLEVTKNTAIKGAVHELLRDEVRHSRIGWAHLASERPQGRGAFLSELLPLILDASMHRNFAEGEDAPWSEEMEPLGELSPAALREVLRETLDKVIFPGLDAVGLDTTSGREWLAARSAGVGATR